MKGPPAVGWVVRLQVGTELKILFSTISFWAAYEVESLMAMEFRHEYSPFFLLLLAFIVIQRHPPSMVQIISDRTAGM